VRTVSLVVPCYNEAAALPALFARLEALIAKIPRYRFEIVCVNDGSTDGTLPALLELQSQWPTLSVVDLSRNFGKEAALSAGLALATGDAVVPMDADLQDPPEVLLEMLSHWEEGFEVVLAQREDRSVDSPAKRVAARFFYRIHNALSDVAIPNDVGDFRLMDRVVVDALSTLPENRRFMKGLFAWIGFRTTTVRYARDARSAGRSRFDTWRLWNFALEGITSFSLVPLRVWTYLGVFVAISAVGWGTFIAARTLVYGRDVPGYASLMVAILLIGGLQLIGIGILGEYLGRTYMESKRRPAFVVRKVFRGKPPE
jgi:glycosyltransferase involved in cell wall biosynthesis